MGIRYKNKAMKIVAVNPKRGSSKLIETDD